MQRVCLVAVAVALAVGVVEGGAPLRAADGVAPAGPPPFGTPMAPGRPPPLAGPSPPSTAGVANRQDRLRSEELQVLLLEQRLGSDNPEMRRLKQSLSDARRRMEQYRLSQTPEDARMRRQSLDDSLRSLHAQRLQAQQRGSGAVQK